MPCSAYQARARRRKAAQVVAVLGRQQLGVREARVIVGMPPVSWTAERWAVRPGRKALRPCQGSRSTESRTRRSFGGRRWRSTLGPIARSVRSRGISESREPLRLWVQQAQIERWERDSLTGDEREEVRELRRLVLLLEQEREILKQARPSSSGRARRGEPVSVHRGGEGHPLDLADVPAARRLPLGLPRLGATATVGSRALADAWLVERITSIHHGEPRHLRRSPHPRCTSSARRSCGPQASGAADASSGRCRGSARGRRSALPGCDRPPTWSAATSSLRRPTSSESPTSRESRNWGAAVSIEL
jgi:hypothetical protein